MLINTLKPGLQSRPMSDDTGEIYYSSPDTGTNIGTAESRRGVTEATAIPQRPPRVSQRRYNTCGSWRRLAKSEGRLMVGGANAVIEECAAGVSVATLIKTYTQKLKTLIELSH